MCLGLLKAAYANARRQSAQRNTKGMFALYDDQSFGQRTGNRMSGVKRTQLMTCTLNIDPQRVL